jgi:hypothetical protein
MGQRGPRDGQAGRRDAQDLSLVKTASLPELPETLVSDVVRAAMERHAAPYADFREQVGGNTGGAPVGGAVLG